MKVEFTSQILDVGKAQQALELLVPSAPGVPLKILVRKDGSEMAIVFDVAAETAGFALAFAAGAYQQGQLAQVAEQQRVRAILGKVQ